MEPDKDLVKELNDVLNELKDVGRIIKSKAFWMVGSAIAGAVIGFAAGAFLV